MKQRKIQRNPARGAIRAGVCMFTLVLFAASGASFAKSDQPEYTIGFVPKLVGIPYFAAMKQGLNKAGEKFDMKVVYQGSTTASVDKQYDITQSMINQGLDAVGVSANSPSALIPLAKKAKKKGILFYSSDSQVQGKAVDLRVQQVKPKALGYKVVDVMANEIGGKGRIAIISGGPTATNLNTWIGYMKERLKKKYPDIKMVSLQYGGENNSKATKIASQLIAAYPDLDGIIGVNSTSVPGAAQAVLVAGKKGKIAVTGITDPNSIRKYVKLGVVNKIVLWNPIKLGFLTGWGVHHLLEGKKFERVNKVPGIGKVKYFPKTNTLLLGPPAVFDKSNIDLDF